MTTKALMITSVVYFAAQGLLLTFIPQELNTNLNISSDETSILISQTLGASFLAFALLNWFTRNHILGGIYGKPLTMANFLFFFVSAMTYLKSGESPVVWVLAGICTVLGLSFGYIAFTHPFKNS